MCHGRLDILQEQLYPIEDERGRPLDHAAYVKHLLSLQPAVAQQEVCTDLNMTNNRKPAGVRDALFSAANTFTNVTLSVCPCCSQPEILHHATWYILSAACVKPDLLCSPPMFLSISILHQC